MLNGFHNLNRFTDPAMVKHRLAERRDPLIPHFGGMTRLEGFFEELENPKQNVDVFFLGQHVVEAVRTWEELGDIEKKYVTLPLWAELFEGEEKAALLAKQAKMTELRAKVFTSIGTLFAGIEPPKAANEKGLLGTAKGLVKASKLLSLRVTRGKGNYSGSVTQYKKISETKVLVREVPVRYEHFGIAYVVDDRPYEWWPDLPNLPASSVCRLMVGVAKKYSKGVDVKLNKWEFYPNELPVPILCKNKDAAGKPL